MATYLVSLVQLCCGERVTANKYHWHVWEVLPVNGPRWVLYSPRWCVIPWVHTAQAPGFSARALSQVDPAFHALPRSKLLRFSGAPQGHRPGWECILCPSQVQAAQVTRRLASAPSRVARASYLISYPVLATRFPRCAVRTLSQVCCVSPRGS